MAKKLKIKKGAWFIKTRGSYLPVTIQGWWLHGLLVLSALIVFEIALNDTRKLLLVVLTTALELIGIAALFTWIASKKA